jgi:predicted  nucleic acid-binding Zn-ribbon protein
MQKIMEQLLALQSLVLGPHPVVAELETEVRERRTQIPPAILGRFDGLVHRGKKAVALVRNGVCSECHLRVSLGTLARLSHTSEVHTCDNCGRFLLVSPTEDVVVSGLVKKRKRKPAPAKASAAARVPTRDTPAEAP